MLPDGFEILGVRPRIGILDDLAEPDLRQFFRNQLLVEQAALDRGLILNEAGDQLIEVLAAYPLGFLAFRFLQPLDLDLAVSPPLLIRYWLLMLSLLQTHRLKSWSTNAVAHDL